MFTLNPLASGRCNYNFELLIFKLISMIDILNIPCDFALKSIWHAPTDDKSTLVQLMARWPILTEKYVAIRYHSVLLFSYDYFTHIF